MTSQTPEISFHVLDCDSPAKGFPFADSKWLSNVFPTHAEAVAYAKKWVCHWKGTLPSTWNGEPYSYNQFCTVSVVKMVDGIAEHRIASRNNFLQIFNKRRVG